ncbi:MAG: copper ion binding protein [Synergistaceae bacterium]|jgi:copper chaperone|nr:copper ion binding protein [Synergistaceae bacterium]
MTEKVFKVDGMSCSHCVKAVTNAISSLDGVGSVSVSLEGGTATVSYDAAKVSEAKIKEAIEAEDYEVKD